MQGFSVFSVKRFGRGFGRCLVVLSAGLMFGCGGDETGVGSGGTGGLASGSVSGFGSIYVDGVRWNDRNARVEVEQNPAAAAVPTSAQLGQRVEIEYTNSEVADVVRIQAEVIGPVAELPRAQLPNQFKVAGQTVRINTDANAGPVTLLVGYTALSQLLLNDIVEVHGVQRYDTALGRHVIQASRVEKRNGLPAGLIRVAGIVENYSAAPNARSFRLGELTVTVGSASVVPANRQLANGQRVIVWSNKALGAGPTLAADFIRIRERTQGSGEARISGVVSRYNAADGNFDLAGTRINVRSANVVPGNQSLANDQYVIVNGSFQTDGSVIARKVQIRKKSNGDVEVEVKGTVTDYVSRANFKVRGLAVDASGVAVLQGCAGNVIGNGLYVEIEGAVSGSKIVAERLKCILTPSGAVVEVSGIASAVNLAASTFTLTSAGGATRTVQWNGLTYFDNVTAATLNGKTLEVEGYNDGAVFVARKIELDD